MQNPALTFWMCVQVVLLCGKMGWAEEPRVRAVPAEDNKAYVARTWTTEDGLPHNVVSRIIQDHTGYIWLATSGGITRFDGRQFKTIELPPDLVRRGYNIRGMVEEGQSTLLLLLPSGDILRLHDTTLSLHPASLSLKDHALSDLFVEPGGVLWAGSFDGTLFRWQDGQTQTFGKSDRIDRRSPSFSFAIDQDGRTWVASGSFLGYYKDGALVPYGKLPAKKLIVAPSRVGGLWVLADSRLYQLLQKHPAAPPAALAELPATALPRQIFEDRNHALWIATRHDGLFRYAQGELKHIDSAGDSVLFVAEDGEGGIWVGTEGNGVSLLRPKFFTLFDADAGLTQKLCSAVCVDSSGEIWIANREDGGARYHQGRFITAAPARRLKANTICASSTGELWVGATDGLYQITSEQKDPPRRIEAAPPDIRFILCAANGDIWFVSHTGVLGYIRGDNCRILSAEDGYIQQRITAIAEDRDGVIWTGSESGTLRKFSDDRLVTVSMPAATSTPSTNTLYVDKRGLLWVGTSDGLFLQGKNGFKRFTQNEGLPDSLILQIQEDDFGYLWLGGRHGIFRVARDQLLDVANEVRARVGSMTLRKEDGIPSLSFVVGGYPLSAKDQNGVLWFTTAQGVIGIDPQKIPSPSIDPPIVIQEWQVDGRPLDIIKPPHRVSPGKHHIKFQFAALSFAAPEKIRLWHQLEGIDPSWIETGSGRSAEYSSLPPGDYRLRVVAKETEPTGNQAGTVFFDFSVTPGWWQTTWARLVGLTVLTGIFVGGLRHYSHWQLKRQLEQLKQAHAMEKERARIARDLHDELGGSLTRIAFGVDQLKRRLAGSEAQALVEQLSQRVHRHASDLQRVVWVESSKNDSLNRVAFFIGRFGQDYFRDSPVNCTVRTCSEIPPKPIPPEVQHNLVAIAKEAFSNVLKHAKATHVVVETGFDRSILEIKIKDNGVGFVPDAERDDNHNGLTNMRLRITELGGELKIQSQSGSGTTILVNWPYPERPSE